MARDKTEEQSATFPLDGGINNTALAQSVQPPSLVSSVNTRLSVTRGVPSRVPHIAALATGSALTGPCQGIVPVGGVESTIAFAVGASERIANGASAPYLDNRGTQKNLHVPSQVTRAGVLPGGASQGTPAVTYDSDNACHWSASVRPYSSNSYGIYVAALSADGELLAQTQLALITTATPTWFSLTFHPGLGAVLWYCDVDASLAIKGRLVTLSNGVVTLGTVRTIYTPANLGVGQAAVVSNGASTAYLVTPHSATATTLAIHYIAIATTAFTVTTVNKTSFTVSGGKVDVDYYAGMVLVAAATGLTYAQTAMFDTSGVETWTGTPLASDIRSDEVSCGFAVIGGTTYAVVTTTDASGTLATGAGNHAGTYVIYQHVASGVQAYTLLLPWVRPVAKLCQLVVGSSVYPLLTVQRRYEAAPSAVSAGFITDPSIETLLLGLHTAAVVGRFGVDTVYNELAQQQYTDIAAVCYGSTKYFLTYRTSKLPVAGFVVGSVETARYVELDFASFQPRYALTSEGTALIAGGLVMAWDGETLTEANPIHRPALSVLGTGAGTTLTSGTYRFSAVHTWSDAKGIKHRSMPADVRSLSGAGNEATTFLAKPLTSRDYVQNESYTVEWYASLQDGTVLYLQYVTNTSSTEYFDLRDDWIQPESGLTHPIIYSDADPSQALISQCPPAALDVAMVGDRCWLIAAESPNELWPSKRREAGTAYEWNSDIRMILNSTCGSAVGLAELVGQLLVMTSTGVFLVNGQGPDNVGNGAWTEPQKIADIPCTSRASVISTPAGVMFISHKRFVKVSSQGSMEVADVDASLMGTVVAAVMDQPRQEVLFIGSSLTYCYNYSLDRWTTWAHLPTPSCAAMGQGGLLVWSGDVLYQAVMSSVSTTAQMSWTTGDINFGAPQDDCVVTDVLIHGRWLGSHGLTVTLTPDYGQGTAVTKTFSAADVLAATSAGQYTLSCLMGTHSMRSLKVAIQETGQSTGLGAQPTNVTVLVSKNPGTKRDAVKPAGRK